MSDIILRELQPDLNQRLAERAAQHQRTIEAEIIAILQSVLTAHKPPNETQNLTTVLEQRFAALKQFELSETPREAIRDNLLFE